MSEEIKTKESAYSDAEDVRKEKVEYSELGKMIKKCTQTLHVLFERNLASLKGIAWYDKLLRELTIDDKMSGWSPNVEFEYDAEKNRESWINIFNKLPNDTEKCWFAALTVYRNSGIACMHKNNIYDIMKHVVAPYMSEKLSVELLLNHLLVVSKIANHYQKLATTGLLNFVDSKFAEDQFLFGMYDNIFRLSFSRPGELVHSYLIKKDGLSFTKHRLLDDGFVGSSPITRINFDVEIRKCNGVSIVLYKVEDVYNYIKAYKNVLNPYGDGIDPADIDAVMNFEYEFAVENTERMYLRVEDLSN